MRDTNGHFWFSEKHLKWLQHCDQTAGVRIKNLTVVIDGKRVPYTAWSDSKTEPYDGALHHFPDYVYIGEGDPNTIKV
jgi:hypothetical protein